MQYTEILLTTKQKNMNTYKEVIDKLPDETPTTMMGDCVNKNLDDLKKYE